MNAKVRVYTYWITTAMVAGTMLMSAAMYLTQQQPIMQTFARLGYPVYFPAILGTAKILGAAALLAPRCALLKEWAYAGFTFTFVGAFVSHLAVGDGSGSWAPLIMLVLLAVSYHTRPLARRLVFSQPE